MFGFREDEAVVEQMAIARLLLWKLGKTNVVEAFDSKSGFARNSGCGVRRTDGAKQHVCCEE